jgi:hypothetical protein
MRLLERIRRHSKENIMTTTNEIADKIVASAPDQDSEQGGGRSVFAAITAASTSGDETSIPASDFEVKGTPERGAQSGEPAPRSRWPRPRN